MIAGLADGSLVVDPVITHEFGIEDTLTAFATANDASVSSKILRLTADRSGRGGLRRPPLHQPEIRFGQLVQLINRHHIRHDLATTTGTHPMRCQENQRAGVEQGGIRGVLGFR